MTTNGTMIYGNKSSYQKLCFEENSLVHQPFPEFSVSELLEGMKYKLSEDKI